MILPGARAYSYAISVFLMLAGSGLEVWAQQPVSIEIECQDPTVAATLTSLSQSIAQNQTAIANCKPPNAPPRCNSSQLASLNATAAQLNSEYQAELMNCRPLQAPPQSAVSVIGIEVTQVVQDMNQSVPLIAGKQTWARVYLSTISPITVTGTLQIQNSSFTITNVQSSTPPATLTPAASLQQMRQSWTASLNFLIPPSSTIIDNAYTLTLADVSSQGGGSLSCGNCGTMTLSVTFVNAPPMRVRLVPVIYTDPNNTVVTPRTVDYALLNSWLARAYPISQLISSQAAPLPTTTPLAQLFTNTASGCNTTDAQLLTLRATEINQNPNPIDARTHYYGMVAIDPAIPNLNGGFMRGCSPIPGFAGSGPTGVSIPFYENYGGHELGHTFGRAHPAPPGATTSGYCGAGPTLDPNYPYPNGQISDNQGDLVGLDVGDQTNGIPLAVLPGASTFDIMTYCPQPLWMSDYTYEGILNGAGGLVQQDPSGNGPARRASETTVVGRFVSVVASINLSHRTGKIEFAQTVDRAARKPPFTTKDRASLRLVDIKGKIIGEYPANVGITSDSAAGEDVTGLVDAVIPYSPDAAKLEFYFGRVRLDQRNISKTPPAVVNTKIEEPGTLRWEVTHEKGFPISFYVQGSPDGQTWETVALGLSKPELRLSPEQLRSYQRVRIVANDGFNNSVPVETNLSPSH